MAFQTFTPDDLRHLRRTVALAAEALEAGDAPFGSVLVGNSGANSDVGTGTTAVLREERNRTKTLNDGTRHPEFELARWAATNMTPSDRAAATVYTSGEHCPMCAAAHAWVGLGRIVYVASAEQLDGWMDGFRREKEMKKEGEEEDDKWKSPVASLSIRQVVGVGVGVEVLGPVQELEGEIRDLHRRYAGLDGDGDGGSLA